MTRWTHALRRPGPHPDQCVAEVVELGSTCLCNQPVRDDLTADVCRQCGHELVALGSRPPSDSPAPPR